MSELFDAVVVSTCEHTHAVATLAALTPLALAFKDGQPEPWQGVLVAAGQKDRNGARSADSLLFLSEAMVGIGDTDRACIALAEFSEAYPAIATGRLKEQYDRDRSRVDCEG